MSGSRSRGPAAVGLRAVAERPKVPCSLGGRREGRMWRGLAFQGPSSLSGGMGIGPSPGQQSPPPLSSFWLFLGRRQPEGLLFRAVVAQVLGGGPGRWGGSFEIRFLSHICGHVATLDHGESLVARSCFFLGFFPERADLPLLSTNEKLSPAFPTASAPNPATLRPPLSFQSPFFCLTQSFLSLSAFLTWESSWTVLPRLEV